MSEASNLTGKVAKTEDDASIKSSTSTDAKRGAFGKSRASSSKQLGSKRISTSTTASTPEEKEKLKKALLEQPEKKKSKSKEATTSGESSPSPKSDPQPERVAIQPLDEATQNALKKRVKKRDSDVTSDSVKISKSKKTPKEEETDEKASSSASSRRRNSQDGSSDSESSKLPKKSRKSPSPSTSAAQIPHLPVVPSAALPPILSDRSSDGEEAGKSSPSAPPAIPPPLTPNGSSGAVPRSPSPVRPPGSPSASSPRPFGSPRSARASGPEQANSSPSFMRPAPSGLSSSFSHLPQVLPPMPANVKTTSYTSPATDVPQSDSSDSLPGVLPPPPASDAEPTEIPVRTIHKSDSQGTLTAQITISNSVSSIGADSDDEDSSREHKKEKRRKNRTDSVDMGAESPDHHSKQHTRERSGTKGRRDSEGPIAPLSLSSLPTVVSTPTSPVPLTSRGLMRMNRTPRGENIISPRGQILIVTPAGENVSDITPPTYSSLNVPSSSATLISQDSVSSLSNSAVTGRDSVDSSDDLSSLKSSLSSSMSEMPPPPPPMPTIGVPPPPPPMPSRGSVATSSGARRDSDASFDEPVIARTRTRRTVPQVDAALKLWDSRATNFESRLAYEISQKSAPEELLEFPHDDLLLEIINSQLEHYPALETSAPPSVRDCYASYTSQLKMVCRQSLWYGTETSPKDRFKEYEMRMSKAKVEAAAQLAANPAPEIRTTTKTANANRRPSMSRTTSTTDTTGGGRRGSRAIKMTNSPSFGEGDMPSALPDLTEDDDSAQESVGDDEPTTPEMTSTGSAEQLASPADRRHSKNATSNSDKPSSSKRGKAPSVADTAHVPPMVLPPSSGTPPPTHLATVRGEAPARSASPDARGRAPNAASTLRPSKVGSDPNLAAGSVSAPTTPAKIHQRLASRSVSGVAGSALDVGAGQATFQLNPKMMALDEKIRRREAEKADAERKGILDIDVFTPLPINGEASDHVQPVETLRPKFETRVMVHFKNLKFALGYEEPFFVSAAFYDIDKRLRLSETFYADFNDQNELIKSLLSRFHDAAQPESLAKRFVANLSYQSPNIYLVIRLNTVLHGDIDDIAEPYSGGTASAKDKQKLMDAARTATSLLGEFQQGFAWAALQVFDERCNFKLSDDNTVPLNKMKNPLSDASLFEVLTAEEKPKPRVLDASISFGAAICTRDKFQLLNCVDSSLVHWPAEVAPALDSKNDKAGAILKSLVKPPTPINDIVREVDVFEQSFDKPTPYWSHVHNLYVYPQHFNLGPKLKAKTVVARVYLMKADDAVAKSALSAVFARCADKNLTTHTSTSVWWESPSAPLWDEIKFKLPHSITDKHHILFVISNINVKVLSRRKEGSNEAAETPLAYCWLNLRDHSLFVKDGEHTVPLVAVPQSVSSTVSSSGTGILYGNDCFPIGDSIEKIDDKSTFTFRTRLVSTVMTQDENLGYYFNEYDRMVIASASGGDKMSSKDKKKMYDALAKADAKVVLKFFPTLFNQLIAQLCNAKSSSVQQSIFRAIVTLSQRVFDLTMVSGKITISDALYAYAIQYFDVPAKATHNPADIIASNWVVLLENAAGAKALSDAGITPSQPLDDKATPAEHSEITALANFSLKDVSWFLFELIFKSLVLKMASGGEGRKNITSPGLQQSISRLVQFADMHRRSVGTGFDHINRVLARTFNRLFSLTDRGFVLDLIYSHLNRIDRENAAAAEFRIRFLQIITDYEHYVPLNTPSYTTIDSIESVPTKFWQHHYLAGLFINELRHMLTADESGKLLLTRHKAIIRLRDLLWKHHLDDRYQAPELRSRIAGMYFPLLMLLVERIQTLMEKTAKDASHDKNSQMDNTERMEWCLCGLWILRYMNREVQLRSWWRGESTENLVNFFTFLKFCLDTFQHEEPMREEIMYLMAESYDLLMDDLDDELKQEGSKVMEALALSMIHLLRIAKTEKLILRMLQIVRTFVIKFKRPLFRYLASYTICGDLTFEVFNLCQSQTKRVMMNATSVLYLMLRTNNDEMGHFARMKLQSTSAVSRLVKNPNCNYDEIRNGLEAMALYKDQTRATSWDNQIREFINRHARIIRDNIRASATAAAFADKKAEIYYQISLEYIYSPDLRITWLANLAQHHEAAGNLLEAAISKVQIASLVAEYLTQVLALKQPVKGIPDDPTVFGHAFPAIKDEKNFSVIWLEGNTILSPSFSEDGFVKALSEAVDLFIRAEDLEGAAEIQLVLAHYFKENRRWEQLAPLGTQIATNSQKLYEANRAQSRVPPNFYRVAFWGKGFEEDDGKEYLYRVNPAVRLADFTTALDERYIEKFGADCYERLGNKPIEEYEHVDLSKKNYLQIVNCEIYYDYDQANAKDRLTYSDRSFDVKRVCFETPYNPEGGKPSEEVSKTYKRKFVLHPAKTFPYLLTRVPIRTKEVKILSPIESAVDLLLSIVLRLKEALNCTPPNTKTVQIILQGSVLTQVNAGPLAIIREFLGHAEKYPEAEVARVAEQIRGFVRRCKFGFALNATLIAKEPSLAPLHEEMSKAFQVLTAEASKYIEL